MSSCNFKGEAALIQKLNAQLGATKPAPDSGVKNQ